jgi:cellulose synthase/poly-beta-1,6-N-acetylglucosamine synthase-like glycosyltransferase
MPPSRSYAKRHDVEGVEVAEHTAEPEHTASNSSFDYYYSDAFNPFCEKDDAIEELIDSDSEDDEDALENQNRVYNNPAIGVLNDNVHQIPGSPWAKPANRSSNRPTEPLPIAKYASTSGFLITFGAVVYLFVSAVSNSSSVGRIIIEMFLAIISFFGLFWNSYFAVSSIFKCFIPAKAFRSNTKYCSMIPEEKPPLAEWLNVTMQIPVYKESLQEVLMPTLKSCIKSRDYYTEHSGAKCNIVVCDDGMMALLKDNFAAAEMLWETIEATDGKVFKLSKLLHMVPRQSRRHLKGLKTHSVYEVFHRMLFYYHYKIGFVARSTVDRRGKFKKASNCNSHLRLVWGAEQLVDGENMSWKEALHHESHNSDGSRYVMFGNTVSIGHLILINDADARMAESVIFKTVPEFLNDPSLGFTQHATKTMDDQRGESFYINMLQVYTDALYQGHFLLSSILGCHPPLVGHSIILRSEAVKQIGRTRTLRLTQRWLNNIGLPFLPIDQVGNNNLQNSGATEFWSECHVSEDFELMIHLYNLGFNGRYIAYPDCEFQEGITRTFDEEAGRHRKFALGAHELMFNPFNSWLGQGVFSPLFRTFLGGDIPSYYKVFLTSYLFSYTSGGCYLIVFSVVAICRILDYSNEVEYIYAFNSAGVLILSIVVSLHE